MYADIHSRGTDGEFAKGPQDYVDILHHFDTRTKGLGDADEVKTKLKELVDGHMVMSLTGATGPEVGRILKDVEEWILNVNPEASKEDVVNYIKRRY